MLPSTLNGAIGLRRFHITHTIVATLINSNSMISIVNAVDLLTYRMPPCGPRLTLNGISLCEFFGLQLGVFAEPIPEPHLSDELHYEERRLLAACDQQLIDLVITGLHTGFRRNELFSLTASDIDFPRRLVWVRAAYAKNATARSVPMTKTLEDVLRPRVLDSLRKNSARLFLNQRGQPYTSCHRGFNRAAKQADIHDLHFHDLRHTFASRLVISGADIRTVQELMGDKTISMTLRYAHLSAGHKQRAMDTMDGEFSKKSPAISHNTAHSEYLPQIPKAV